MQSPCGYRWPSVIHTGTLLLQWKDTISKSAWTAGKAEWKDSLLRGQVQLPKVSSFPSPSISLLIPSPFHPFRGEMRPSNLLTTFLWLVPHVWGSCWVPVPCSLLGLGSQAPLSPSPISFTWHFDTAGGVLLPMPTFERCACVWVYMYVCVVCASV
jgi:hypothetical protein